MQYRAGGGRETPKQLQWEQEHDRGQLSAGGRRDDFGMGIGQRKKADAGTMKHFRSWSSEPVTSLISLRLQVEGNGRGKGPSALSLSRSHLGEKFRVIARS